MTSNTSAVAFKALHTPGKPVLLTNIWDALSARTIADLPGTQALATASYAVAMINGTQDDDMTFEQNLDVVANIAPVAKKTGKPLTVDIQDAYGDRLEEALTKLLELGVVGVNLEDVDKDSQEQHSTSEAAGRVRRALTTAKKHGVPDFVVNARCDTLVRGGKIEDAIERGKAYLDAGATTVFVWGGSKRGVSTEEVKLLTREFEGRLNVSLKPGGLTIAELAEIGVARISIGPALLFEALGAVKTKAESLIAQAAG